jgi:dipeptidyl aminopeptidase/acylaminoacyl peptidase
MDARCTPGRSPHAERAGPAFFIAFLAAALGLLIGGPAAPQAVAQPTASADSVRSPIRASDLLQTRRIAEVAVSPDGRYVAYTVLRAATSGRPPSAGATGAPVRRQIYLVPASGRREARPMTRSAPAHSPAWHPESDRLAFVRPVNGTPQVFVLSLTGGEPVQVTDMPHGATRPAWSPSGDRLLFASDLPASAVRARTGRPEPSERPGRTPGDTTWTAPVDTLVVLRDTTTFSPVDTASVALGDSLRALSDSLGAVRDTITVAGAERPAPSPDGSLRQVRTWLERSRTGTPPARRPQVFTRPNMHAGGRAADATYRHFFVAPISGELLEGASPRRRAHPVTSGFRSFAGASWLPGGGQVVVSGSPPSDRHVDRVRGRDLYLADARLPARAGSTGAPRRPVRPRVQRLLHLEHHALSSPRITADGTTVAFRARDLRAGGYAQHEIGLFALDGRTKPQLITGPFDRDPGPIQWSPDGWHLYTIAPSRGGTALYRFAPFGRSDTTDAPTPPPVEDASSKEAFEIDTTMTRRVPYERLTDPPRSVLGIDATDATVVYAAADPGNPSELYANTVRFSNERRLSSHNADWLARRQVASAERFTVARDSLPVEGWLVRPAPESAVGPYPLAVVLPGGPGSMAGPGLPSSWHALQMLAARGFAVALVNPRGAAGYGRAFRQAAYRDWGPGPGADVLAAADAADDRAWVDSTRQVLVGSGGGATLAAWVAGQTDRFRAVVAENGTYDLPALMGSRAWTLVPEHFGGYPWSRAAGRDTAARRAPRPALPPASGQASAPTETGAPVDGPPGIGAAADSARVDSAGARAALARSTPLNRVDDIRSPLLLLGPDAGPSADGVGPGVSQVERLYTSLKALGRPVEYVRYPTAAPALGAVVTPAARASTPGPPLPLDGPAGARVDRLLRIYEFAARYVCSANCEIRD